MAVSIRIAGIKELQRELRAIDKTLPRELRVVHKDVAQIVAEEAQAKGKRLGGVHAKVAGQTRAGAQQRRGFVKVSNTRRLPMALGAQWGAAHDRPRRVRTPSGGTTLRRGWNQLPVRRQGGYTVYPAIADKGDEMFDAYETKLDALIRRAFPD